MTDANDRLYITQTTFQHLVTPNLCHIAQSKQTVIGKHGSYSHTPSMHDRFQSQRTQRSVSMYDIDRFSNKDLAEVRERGEKVG